MCREDPGPDGQAEEIGLTRETSDAKSCARENRGRGNFEDIGP